MQITTLSPQQQDRLTDYRDRWWATLTASKALNPEQAKAAVKNVYIASGLDCPRVMLFQGPLDFRDYVVSRPLSEHLEEFGAPILQLPLLKTLSNFVQQHVEPNLLAEIIDTLEAPRLSDFSVRLYSAVLDPLIASLPNSADPIELSDALPNTWLEQVANRYWQDQATQWERELRQQPGGNWIADMGQALWNLGNPLNQWANETFFEPLRHDPIIQEFEAGFRQIFGFFSLFGLGIDALHQSSDLMHPVVLDFCNQELNCIADLTRWKTLEAFLTNCGLALTFERVCIIFERPTQLSFDETGQFHGEGEPALTFGDGYCRYCFQGVNLPPRYGPIHPNLWRSEWILKEPNAELRRVLIQGIGYSRICQELQAKELDSWREYTLLRIDQPIDIEPVFLLKMTCPSTGSIHATRVPPSVETARDAIRWVNWDIDPESFTVET